MSVWFDVKKEPLPTNVEQVLVKVDFCEGGDLLFRVLDYKQSTLPIDKGYYDEATFYTEAPYNSIYSYNIDGSSKRWSYDKSRVTHWQYIDPSGLPD